MLLETVQIEITNLCNESCVHCYIPRTDTNHHMDSALLFSIIDQCKEIGVTEIVFSGGEPMQHQNFFDAVSHADWNLLKIRIFSNLTLLDEDKLAKLKFCQRNIHEIQTSLYSIKPDIHDKITRYPGSCELTKKWIERLTEANIPVFISCPITKINKDSYIDVLAFAKNHGLRAAPNNIIIAQSDRRNTNLVHRLDINEALQVIRDILKYDTAYNAERFLPGYKNKDNLLPCALNVCKQTLCINANGEVIPQPGWHKVLGDLNNQSLRDIWKNSPQIKELQEISINDFPKCKKCPDIQFCNMSLEANANENPEGDPFVIPEHICTYTRDARKMIHAHHRKLKEVINALSPEI